LVKQLKETVPEPPVAPPAAPDVEAALRALKGAQHLGEAGRRLRCEYPHCSEPELLAALREGTVSSSQPGSPVLLARQ
jgi:hypothetical protein